MGYNIENDCVGCPQGCANCGRDRDYRVYYCDCCEEHASEDNPLYVYENKELCWECYKAQYTEKICDDMDDTLCAHCGYEAEIMYLVDGEWVCEDCLRNIAEKVYMEG